MRTCSHHTCLSPKRRVAESHRCDTQVLPIGAAVLAPGMRSIIVHLSKCIPLPCMCVHTGGSDSNPSKLEAAVVPSTTAVCCSACAQACCSGRAQKEHITASTGQPIWTLGEAVLFALSCSTQHPTQLTGVTDSVVWDCRAWAVQPSSCGLCKGGVLMWEQQQCQQQHRHLAMSR